MENFSEIHAGSRERKQWVKRVMMGNRSEIKLKTKHQMAENRFCLPLLDETFFHGNVVWCGGRNVILSHIYFANLIRIIEAFPEMFTTQ